MILGVLSLWVSCFRLRGLAAPVRPLWVGRGDGHGTASASRRPFPPPEYPVTSFRGAVLLGSGRVEVASITSKSIEMKPPGVTAPGGFGLYAVTRQAIQALHLGTPPPHSPALGPAQANRGGELASLGCASKGWSSRQAGNGQNLADPQDLIFSFHLDSQSFLPIVDRCRSYANSDLARVDQALTYPARV